MKIEKKNPSQFFFPTFEVFKVSNFTSGWVQYCAGLCRQYRNAGLTNYFSPIQGVGSNISNTRKCVSSDIQTLRSRNEAQPTFF